MPVEFYACFTSWVAKFAENQISFRSGLSGSWSLPLTCGLRHEIRTVSNATPKQAMVRSVVGASPVEVRPGEQEAMAASLAGSNRSRHMTTASAHGSTQRTPGQDRARNPNSVVLTRQESTKIFYELDADGNGEVSQIEYIKALRKNPNLAQRLGLPSQIRQEEDARYL